MNMPTLVRTEIMVALAFHKSKIKRDPELSQLEAQIALGLIEETMKWIDENFEADDHPVSHSS